MLKRSDVKYIKALYAVGPAGAAFGTGALFSLFYETDLHNPFIPIMMGICLACGVASWFLGAFAHRRWAETQREVLRGRFRDD